MLRVIILLLFAILLSWPSSNTSARQDAPPQVSIQSPLPGKALQGMVTVAGTPTPLPPNPAEVSRQDLLSSLGKGALAAIGLFALIGIYGAIQKSKEKD